MESANRDEPSTEAVKAADMVCDWLQRDSNPIEANARLPIQRFIQSAIDKAVNEAVKREREALRTELEALEAYSAKLKESRAYYAELGRKFIDALQEGR